MQEFSDTVRRAADVFKEQRVRASRACRNPYLQVEVFRNGNWVTELLGSVVRTRHHGDVYAEMREFGFLRHDGQIDAEVAQAMGLPEFDDS